ncbi:hypothetical protein HRR83_004491 [Exophiala dermatitidis]|uniref:Uncharacterized protein n=1 Tax=Exophiala dermatitidis TaxID=5970 RepID=A0AAN6IWN5_EXODE|nr:hypothetical protein HRR74_004229 [Exophiala dermatitidis]KAJ4529302.1 hypothetical protein HRR73_000325 [Exophiala dermatitidis]KAJ4544045.1 hypothetical protein HRR76_002118 [Exophiala dermatitidis]KAJ4549219.1 hypothetical protein HRR77_004095 [Exophiala dermatitidis]KAJ4575508.1 hypothetical protein HRR79_002428 [Exophiala dermatitidis]
MYRPVLFHTVTCSTSQFSAGFCSVSGRFECAAAATGALSRRLTLSICSSQPTIFQPSPPPAFLPTTITAITPSRTLLSILLLYRRRPFLLGRSSISNPIGSLDISISSSFTSNLAWILSLFHLVKESDFPEFIVRTALNIHLVKMLI